ncbi:TPA: hypothetical protein I0I20_RS01995 [Enterococcus faecium]|uniref:hypothetical protein n=1 Tax=Enterococcus faecium TaxID=1352 RepID=UPI001923BBA1|nr:hypothetical protein [Enterococcus faecium]EHK9936732.1 hypothetical protein [Enterococcus faecium]
MEELQMVALNELLKQQQQIMKSQEEIKKELQAIRNSNEQIDWDEIVKRRIHSSNSE